MRLPNVYPQLISNNSSATLSRPTETERNDSEAIASISVVTTNNSNNTMEPTVITNNKTL